MWSTVKGPAQYGLMFDRYDGEIVKLGSATLFNLYIFCILCTCARLVNCRLFQNPRDSMDLAFRYFTSSTLTVRLAGLNQITVSFNSNMISSHELLIHTYFHFLLMAN